MVIGTDAGGFDPDTTTAIVHPRAYGTFPRILGSYVRERQLLTLEDAVRKMTWSRRRSSGCATAACCKEGMFADVVVFDPATIIDNATFEKPHQLSTGVVTSS